MFELILFLRMVELFYAGKVLINILQIIAFTLGVIYCSGMVIVHYNILLDDDNLLGSALGNVSNGKNKADDQMKLLDDQSE